MDITHEFLPTFTSSSSNDTIKEFIPKNIKKIFKQHLGPNWLFHAMNELNARNKSYAYFDEYEYPDKMSTTQASLFADMIASLLPDITSGSNIMDKNTLTALYNWAPKFKIRDTLTKHPDWKIHSITQGGGACITSIHEKGYSPYSGIHIPHDTIEQRKASWRDSVKKLLKELQESNWVCLVCEQQRMLDDENQHIPDRPPLMRCNAEPIRFCHEIYQVRCPMCDSKVTQYISFSE